MDIPNPQRRAVVERVRLVRQVLKSFRIVFASAQEHSRWVESQCGASSPQVWALSEIASNPGCRVSELANSMSLHQSTVSNILEKLEKKSLIRRERDDRDQRAMKLFITEEGEDLLRTAPQPATSLLPDTLHRLPEDALRALDVSMREVLLRLGSKDRKAGLEPINKI